jgi:hypothetical protein
MAGKMPREIASGVFWIGDCLAQRHKGKVYHGYNAAYLIAGETASCLVETGHPKDFPVIERHMGELFARGVPPLKYLFVTHQETPHCGGLGRVLKTFPDTLLCGDVSDYHLAFPQYEDRMRWMQEGDEIDLGGRSLMAVEPVIRDLRTTWWAFETPSVCCFRRRLRLQPLSRGRPLRFGCRGGHFTRLARCVFHVRRLGAFLDQVCRHERVLRSARLLDRAVRDQDNCTDPRPSHHRCKGHGAKGAGRTEGRGSDARVGNQ